MFVKNDYNPTAIALRIKAVLKAKKTTQKELFTSLGMAVNTLDNYKKSMPKSDNLAYIADYLDCSVDYLLGRTDNPNVNLNLATGNNSLAIHSIVDSSVGNISNGFAKTSDDAELLELIKKLPLKKRVKVISMIYDELEEV